MFTVSIRQRSRRHLAFVLFFLVFLSGCTPYIPIRHDVSPESSIEEDSSKEDSVPMDESSLDESVSDSLQRANMDFQDMTYERPDMEGIYAECDRLLQTLSLGLRSSRQVLSLYDELLDDFDHVCTLYTLASLYSDLDLSDGYYLEEISFLSEAMNELSYRLTEITDTLLLSPYASAFQRHMGQNFVDRYLSSYDLSYEEAEELLSRETDLLNQYSQYTVADYTTTLNGREVSLNDLTLSTQEEWDAYDEIYAQKNADCAGIYRELVQIRTEMAALSGYDSYIDYAYASFNRDYTKEDTLTFSEQIKEYFVPLLWEFEETYEDILYDFYPQNYVSEEMAIYYLQYALDQEFSPDMAEALSYMLDYHLYTFSHSTSAFPGAYTTYLSETRSPFLLINSLYYSPATTLFHEFGHYYNYYLYDGSGWNDEENIDLGEVHSQGLELLMLPYYSEIFKEDAAHMEILLLHSILSAVVTGCCEEEFQQRVFENPEMTVEEMNELHDNLSMEYFGYSSYYEWVDIFHHFESPFYYIGYATSGIAALELWALAEDDRDAALTAYETLCEFTVNSGFLEPLAQAGLGSPFDEEVLTGLARLLSDLYLQTTEPAPNSCSSR